MDDAIIVVRNRTIRRQERKLRLDELATDLVEIENRLAVAKNQQTILLLTKLRDVVYTAYIEVVDSEV